MDASGQLAEFLQVRRAQLRPQDVGLPTYGDRRRVPGLRREELAMLAGVSPSYYIRLEQGQSPNASPEVIDAIARALRLDEAEHDHLRDLAQAKRRRGGPRRPPAERITPEMTELLTALGDVPAIVTGRRTDALAWNRMGHALLLGHVDAEAPERPGERPSMARHVFLDPHTRELYVNWPAKARAVVENLRMIAGQHPDDAALAALIGELSMRSPEFAKLWADHRVRPCGTAQYQLRHPIVGTLTVHQQTLNPVHSPGQSMVIVTATGDAASQAALTLLAQTLSAGSGLSAGADRREGAGRSAS
ncbi:helix-turn-helix domain-containing protein [Nocardia sp. NPDC020380]|uniref:helix-turn-helix domain-containing protein n=1 Tax=Nocardia sp. NPDC020380 TaxID=3364309 RepID=UPI0037B5932F